MKTIRGAFLVLLVVLLLFLPLGCTSRQEASGEDTAEIVAVERGSLATSITAVGNVRPGAQVGLSFEISGLVTQVMVDAGERVQPGQPIAQLDAADLELQVRSADASLNAAQAALDQLLAGPSEQEIRAARGQLAAAQAALDQSIAQRDQLISGTLESEILVAQAQTQAAELRVVQLQRQIDQTRAQDPNSEVEIAQVELERAQINLSETQDEYNKALDRPWEDQSIRDGWAKQVTQAQLAYRQARARLDQASNNERAYQLGLQALEAQLKELITAVQVAEIQGQQIVDTAPSQRRAAQAAVDAARAQVDIAQAQLDSLLAGPLAAEKAAAQANVDQARVALDSARLSMERATLRAPFGGVIGTLDIAPGKLVSPQVPVTTLVDERGFSVEADVDEADIGWLGPDLPVKVTFDAFPGRSMDGRVTAILPSGVIDLGVISYRVLVALDPTDLPLRGDMTANVEIVREQRHDVLVVPNRAIWIESSTGKPFVEKQVGGVTEVVFIEQGISNSEYSEIVSGLQEGDQLVIRSASIRDRFRQVVTTSMTGQ